MREETKVNKRLLISFSGGETSAYMTKRLLDEVAHKYAETKVLFANTGQEREETLEFVRKCDEEFGFNTIWLEAVVKHGLPVSNQAKVVDFSTASRNGEPFEESIKKYGIPNSRFPQCTRDLKLYPMQNYLASIGWKKGTYDTAIGIRVDEVDRMSVRAKDNGIIYPLISMWPTTKRQINTWFANQSFRLNLTGYQGNCAWCWKKSNRKHMTLLKENVGVLDFPRRMEELYGHIGPEFKKGHIEGYKRTFFRGNKSAADLVEQFNSLPSDFVFADDENQKFDPDFDLGGGCEESCEVFSDEDLS